MVSLLVAVLYPIIEVTEILYAAGCLTALVLLSGLAVALQAGAGRMP